MASDLVAVETHDLVLDQILNLLDRHGVARVLACLGDVLRRINHLAVGKTRALLDLQVCGADGIDDLIDVKDNLGAAALDDLHPLAFFRVVASLRFRAKRCPAGPAPALRRRRAICVLDKP